MPEFVAHRGESYDAPENTMASFRLAWERGIRTFELDTRLTRDGQLIVCHDATTQRTTGQALEVAASSAAELRALDAGSWKHGRYRGERLPLLSEVLAATPPQVRCLVEVKCGAEAVPALARVLDETGTWSRVTVISFHREPLTEARRCLPGVPTWLITGFRKDGGGQHGPSVEAVLASAAELGVAGVAWDRRGPIDEASVAAVRAAGLTLNVWTVDEVADALPFWRLSVDTITSNRAAWLRDRVLAAEGRA